MESHSVLDRINAVATEPRPQAAPEGCAATLEAVRELESDRMYIAETIRMVRPVFPGAAPVLTGVKATR